MRENKVIYGLIGYGGMGRWHTEILSNVPEIEIGGIYDIKEEKRIEAKEKGFSVYGSEEEMLSDPDIDVVLIATPNDCHKPIAIRAMHAGKNVISEKPVTLSSSDLQEMVNVAKETGKFLTVHQNRRWDDDFLIIRKLVEEQKLGHVFRIESRVHGSRGIPGDWRKEKIHGGGMVLDWGVHLLDQILYLYGDRKIETVYASLTHITNQEVDDGFTTILTFESFSPANPKTYEVLKTPRFRQNAPAYISWNVQALFHSKKYFPLPSDSYQNRHQAPIVEKSFHLQQSLLCTVSKFH